MLMTALIASFLILLLVYGMPLYTHHIVVQDRLKVYYEIRSIALEALSLASQSYVCGGDFEESALRYIASVKKYIAEEDHYLYNILLSTTFHFKLTIDENQGLRYTREYRAAFQYGSFKSEYVVTLRILEVHEHYVIIDYRHYSNIEPMPTVRLEAVDGGILMGNTQIILVMIKRRVLLRDNYGILLFIELIESR